MIFGIYINTNTFVICKNLKKNINKFKIIDLWLFWSTGKQESCKVVNSSSGALEGRTTDLTEIRYLNISPKQNIDIDQGASTSSFKDNNSCKQFTTSGELQLRHLGVHMSNAVRVFKYIYIYIYILLSYATVFDNNYNI